MPTLADTIDLTSGTISFTLSTAPYDGAQNVATGRPKLVATDSLGAFSTTLVGGYYIVRMPHTPAFTVYMPASGGPYDLEDVTTAVASGEVIALSDEDAANLTYKRPTWIVLSEDFNGDPASFEYDATSDTSGTEGVDWIQTAEARIYRRQPLELA